MSVPDLEENQTYLAPHACWPKSRRSFIKHHEGLLHRMNWCFAIPP